MCNSDNTLLAQGVDFHVLKTMADHSRFALISLKYFVLGFIIANLPALVVPIDYSHLYVCRRLATVHIQPTHASRLSNC